MNNKITLRGIIKNIQYSHTIQDIEFYKANLIVPREDSTKEDLIDIKFKRFSNPYKENEEIVLCGNIRSYSQTLGDKNKVSIYVFTYFDKPEIEYINKANLKGRICKSNGLRKTKDGKDVIDFILANNIANGEQSLNCYIPCVAWGKLAKELAKLPIGTEIAVEGQLQSREYKKRISEDDFEIRVAHELNVNEFTKLEDTIYEIEI